MSFITKRERVFHEYDLFDLPSRNEGKMKAFASCTDARAWSHFCSDKTEHLVDIIKRNNEICRPKYVPTGVIVDTLMGLKNTEISRLKRKIEEFEQLLAAYDMLDLTCAQKCEIANAHEAIKVANKELEDVCLGLDLSGCTEGMDSEAFETGKSRGDEPFRYGGCDEVMSRGSESTKSRGDEWTPCRTDSKCNQTGLISPREASTNAYDPRIEEMQGVIITKDAKLNAMQNTIAVMENDVCEPYCLYAHIYTALEKIFGVLCQNDRYKLYLNLMTAGKDIRCIDIKGKILFKLKVLEKFSLALIAPCSQPEAKNSTVDCACLRAEIIERIDLTPTETVKNNLDDKRAHLVADIMENDEMKDIISKESDLDRKDDDQTEDGGDDYSIDTENLRRLKNLQQNYDELMMCYEKVKYDKDCLQGKCMQYQELEKEFDSLNNQLQEYNSLWNEKEHYRQRSLEIDSLKEQYFVLSDETASLETQLKAESEINMIKSYTIDELRSENIALEKKINDARITFDKEKNTLECKLKESECTIMLKEQQIKSLSIQIDRFLEQGQDRIREDPSKSLELIDELEACREQIKNLKDTLYCCEDEKQQLQDEFQEKLKIINDLKLEIEDWKSSYDKALQHNDHLEKYTDNVQEQVHKLIDENKALSQDVKEKIAAVENLRNVIDNKSQQVETLLKEIEKKDDEKKFLYRQFQTLQDSYKSSVATIESERSTALNCLQLIKKESQDILNKVNSSSSISCESTDDMHLLKLSANDKVFLSDQSNTPYPIEPSGTSEKKSLLNEIQKVRDVNSYVLNNIANLQDERNEIKKSLQLNKKESELLEKKLLQYEGITKEMENLQSAHDNLKDLKEKLENDLRGKSCELELALESVQICRKESEELVNRLDDLKNVESDNNLLRMSLSEKNKKLENLLLSLSTKNEDLLNTSHKVTALENELMGLRLKYDELLKENNALLSNLTNKTEEINSLSIKLQSQIEEKCDLLNKVASLELKEKISHEHVMALQEENLISQNTLEDIKKESAVLINKLQHFETLEAEYDKLKQENECMNEKLKHLTNTIEKSMQENSALSKENQNLNSINEDLEKSLIQTRKQLVSKSDTPSFTYEDIFTELENIKKEKIQGQHKIKELSNKLDESDKTIMKLNEEMCASYEKITILENHINELEDEIRRLHANLERVIDTGEQISTNSIEKYDNSLRSLDAHYSKAAHNIQMDLAKLRNENSKLGEQLSVTKMKTEEFSKDKTKYLSQVIHLQNEISAIATNVKQLELRSVGDSALFLEQCTKEDILTSLDRISKSMEAKNSKGTLLEQTILKVQTSSQLLKSKADEAKKIIEKEKQKIMQEKEDAIKEKLNLENRLHELKKKLENQIFHDGEIIKDLEASIENQKLISQNTIAKLQAELQALSLSYQSSTAEVEELQERMRKLSEENKTCNEYLEINDKLTTDLIQKSKNITKLQKEVQDLKNKSNNHDIEVQVSPIGLINKATQASETFNTEFNKSLSGIDTDIKHSYKVKEKSEDSLKVKHYKTKEANQLLNNILPNQNQSPYNEVQILTANVEPSFDFVRSSYLKYKIQRLGLGKLEQFSNSNENLLASGSQVQQTQNENDSCLVDIYKESDNSASFKLNTNEIDIEITNKQSDDTNLSTGTALNTNTDSYDNENSEDYKQMMAAQYPRRIDDSDDIFLIYKDKKNTTGLQHSQLDKTANLNSNNVITKETKNRSDNIIQDSHIPDNEFYAENDLCTEEDEDDSVKPKLKITLPRVDNDSQSAFTVTEFDNKSINSVKVVLPTRRRSSNIEIKISDKKLTSKHDTPSLPAIPNDGYNNENKTHNQSNFKRNIDRPHLQNTQTFRNEIRSTSQPNKRNKLSHGVVDGTDTKEKPKQRSFNNNTNKLGGKDKELDKSNHSLSRVDADVFLIESRDYNKREGVPTKQQNFALDYILDTVQREVDSEEMLNAINDPHLSLSDDGLSMSKLDELGDSISLKIQSALKDLSPEYIHQSINVSHNLSYNKLVDLPISKAVSSKPDEVKKYQDKIKFLTKSLEMTEEVYKKKLEAIKLQYDSNIKNIINEHNQGVKNIQSLHEDTLQDIIKIHENEIENLRTISIDANRKADKLERENRSLKNKVNEFSLTALDEEPTKIVSNTKKLRETGRSAKLLTKTDVVPCNLKPEVRSYGPCTCSLDVDISDTIRNIFEQVDVDQRKIAEYTYLKYIAKKILSGNVEALDAQELSFLHLRVCRTWKMKLSQEEAFQRQIDNLESELINRQRHAQQHIAELDRKLEEEKKRLQEVREAVCRSPPSASRTVSLESGGRFIQQPPSIPEKDLVCACNSSFCGVPLGDRRSAGDLVSEAPTPGLRTKRTRIEHSRAVSAKVNAEEKRERKLYHDDPPTKLRRSHDKTSSRLHKK